MQVITGFYNFKYNLKDNSKYGIRLNTLNRDAVSFGKGKDINKEVKEIPESAFPSPEYREYVLANIDNSDILALHKKYYAGLLNCESLDEAKRLFPEFENVIDMKDIDLSKVNHQNILHKIAKGEIAGINRDNATLELLKKYYGELLAPKGHEKEYFGLNRNAVKKLLQVFNIKMDEQYERIIASQRRSNSLVVVWQDDEFRRRTSMSIKKAANTPEHKELISRITIARWQDEDYKKKMSEKLSERWQDEDFRQRTIERLKRTASTEEFRKKMSDISVKLWQDEDFRQRALEGIRKVANTDEFRQKISETSIQRWQDEDFREKALEAIRSATQTAEFRQKMADITIQQWQDEEYRQKTLEGIRRVTASDEYRQKMSETTGQLWQDEEYRQKTVEGIRRGTRTEEYRKQKSEAAQAYWQDEEYINIHKISAAAQKLAFKMHPYAQEAYQTVSKDFPWLSVILSKPADSLTEDEIIYKRAYFKACDERYPNLKKEVGEIQKQILDKWGFYDKDRDIDKLMELIESLNFEDFNLGDK